jgi:hypothetical protein
MILSRVKHGVWRNGPWMSPQYLYPFLKAEAWARVFLNTENTLYVLVYPSPIEHHHAKYIGIYVGVDQIHKLYVVEE